MSYRNNIAFGVGVFLIISGIIIGFSWPMIFTLVLKERLELTASSETFNLWIKTPLPLYFEIYLFNWTNSEEFLKNKKIKPEFEEVGPFVFREVHERVNITWHENNTVSYNQTRTWYYEPEKSLDLSTPITNLNVIATTIATMASKGKIVQKALLDILDVYYKEKLIITKSAGEWLFEGMDDKVLNFLKTIVDIPLEKFAWFYGRNLSSSFDGRFNMKTGTDDIYNLGNVAQWNYVNKTKFYDGECGAVKGSSGDIFSPLKSSQSNLSIFITDFCGPLMFKYSGQVTVEGLDGYHYVGDDSVFDNGTKFPKSKCFCSGDCSPSGVRNVTSCRLAPLFISFPHFYLADPVYTNEVGGMRPNKSEHEFYLSIDPVSGIPLDIRAQLQVNLLLQPMSWCPLFKDVPKVYVPMMWFRQRVKVTEEIASRGKLLEIIKKMGLGLACALAALGVLVIIIKVCFIKFNSESGKSEILITPNENKEEENDSDR